MGPLSPELEEVARKELRETPDIKEEAVNELRELLKGKLISNYLYFSTNIKSC